VIVSARLAAIFVYFWIELEAFMLDPVAKAILAQPVYKFWLKTNDICILATAKSSAQSVCGTTVYIN